ncbi:MAG TPA: ABC transporter substrate-binding protein, partial [Pseudolabrys sp.]|nr:ABC transporter substrate-binding protein [Pseudolabrys sp.]
MFRRIGIVLAAILLSGATFAGAHAENTKLTVMVFIGVQNLPILAAQSQGFFARRGLSVDVKIAPNSEVMRKGLADGDWQIIHTAVDSGVAMADVAKVDVVAVIGGDNSFNHLVAQPEIKSVADLRGKTVIVDAVNTAYAFQLYDILRKNGLYKGDYAVKSVGATFKRLAAMKDDRTAAAAILNPPFSILAARAGLKDLGPVMTVIGPYQATAGITLRKWAQTHRDTLVKYLQAYIEGLRWSLDPKNKEAAIRILVMGLRLDPAVAAACYALIADPANGLARDGRFDIAGFENVLKLRAEFEGGVPQPSARYIDLSYYRKALDGL